MRVEQERGETEKGETVLSRRLIHRDHICLVVKSRRTVIISRVGFSM